MIYSPARIPASLVLAALLAGCSGSNARTLWPQGPTSITLTPATLSFSKLGAANAQNVTVAETGFAGPFAAGSLSCVQGNLTVATIAATSSTTFSVIATAAGSCSVNIDGSGAPAVLPVSVNVVPLVPTPASLVFLASGASSAQTFGVSEAGYTGAFTETDTCKTATTLATVSAASGPGPNATFTVTPLSAGSCTISVHDTNGQTSSVSVDITTTNGGVN